MLLSAILFTLLLFFCVEYYRNSCDSCGCGCCSCCGCGGDQNISQDILMFSSDGFQFRVNLSNQMITNHAKHEYVNTLTVSLSISKSSWSVLPMNIRRRISIGGRPFFVATVEKHLATGSFHHVPQLTWWLIHIVRKCSSDYGRGICQRSVHVRITWVGKSSAKIIIVSIIVITKITNHYSSLSSWKTHRDSSTCTHIGPQR